MTENRKYLAIIYYINTYISGNNNSSGKIIRMLNLKFFLFSILAHISLGADDFFNFKDECLESTNLKIEDIKNLTIDGEPTESQYCFLKCIMEKSDELTSDGTVVINVLNNPIYSKVSDDAKEKIVNCVKGVGKVVECADMPQIIKKSGYPFMEYKVKTIDGYILSVFRIPSVASTKPAVFLMHGVQGTSAIFLGLGRNSLAFLLYEAGYDVWLGNYRGTEYSEGHDTMNVTQREYWDYSVDDIALKDIPTMLQLVKYHSGHRGKIIYKGHSLGTTTGIMYAAEYGESAADTLGLLVLLTPAYKLPNMRSPYRLFFPLLNPALQVTNALNLVQTVSSGNLRNFTRPLCSSSPPLMFLCLNVMNLFLGPFTQIAPETVPVFFNQIPAGTSLKTLTYLNEATMNRFRKYDYGPGKNRYLYGSDMPPEFDLKNIKVPVYIMYARNDWSTTRRDSRNFYNTLPADMRYGMHEISNLNFNHYDFLFGRDSKSLVTDRLLQVLDGFISNTSTSNFNQEIK